MSADTLISVDGLDVIASGSVVVLLNSKISISLSEEDEEVEVEFIIPQIPQSVKGEMSSRLVASDKSKPPLLQITIPVWGRLSAHVSEAPEKIGEFENRRLYVSFIAFVAGADTVQFSYTFYLGESLVGQA